LAFLQQDPSATQVLLSGRTKSARLEADHPKALGLKAELPLHATPEKQLFARLAGERTPAPLLAVLPRRVRMQLLAQDQFAFSEPIWVCLLQGQAALPAGLAAVLVVGLVLPAPLLVVLPRRVRMQLLAQDQFASSEPIWVCLLQGQAALPAGLAAVLVAGLVLPAPLLAVLPRRVRMQLLARDQFAFSEPIWVCLLQGQAALPAGLAAVLVVGLLAQLVQIPALEVQAWGLESSFGALDAHWATQRQPAQQLGQHCHPLPLTKVVSILVAGSCWRLAA